MAFIRGASKKDVPSRVVLESSKISNVDDMLMFAESKGIQMEPLDLNEIVNILGLKLTFEPLQNDVSGSLYKDKIDGYWRIKVNSLHHPNRQRFTIAHEVAHYILHRKDSTEFNDSEFFRNSELNSMEREANSFASEVLMPREKFMAYIKNTSSKIEDIASHFHVSAQAVQLRAKSLGLAERA